MDDFNLGFTITSSCLVVAWLIAYIFLMVRLNLDYSLRKNKISNYDLSVYGSIILVDVLVVLALMFVVVQAIYNDFSWVLLVAIALSWLLLILSPLANNVVAANLIHKTMETGKVFPVETKKLNILNGLAFVYGIAVFCIHLYLVFYKFRGFI